VFSDSTASSSHEEGERQLDQTSRCEVGSDEGTVMQTVESRSMGVDTGVVEFSAQERSSLSQLQLDQTFATFLAEQESSLLGSVRVRPSTLPDSLPMHHPVASLNESALPIVTDGRKEHFPVAGDVIQSRKQVVEKPTRGENRKESTRSTPPMRPRRPESSSLQSAARPPASAEAVLPLSTALRAVRSETPGVSLPSRPHASDQPSDFKWRASGGALHPGNSGSQTTASHKMPCRIAISPDHRNRPIAHTEDEMVRHPNGGRAGGSGLLAATDVVARPVKATPCRPSPSAHQHKGYMNRTTTPTRFLRPGDSLSCSPLHLQGAPPSVLAPRPSTPAPDRGDLIYEPPTEGLAPNVRIEGFQYGSSTQVVIAPNSVTSECVQLRPAEHGQPSKHPDLHWRGQMSKSPTHRTSDEFRECKREHTSDKPVTRSSLGGLARVTTTVECRIETEPLDKSARNLIRSRSGPLADAGHVDRCEGEEQLIRTRGRSIDTRTEPVECELPNPACPCFADAIAYARTLSPYVSMFVHLDANGVCYCETCRADENIVSSVGRPHRADVLPPGWVCLPLRCGDLQAKALGALDWDIAYHATTSERLPQVLATGRLVKPGDRVAALDGQAVGIRGDTGRIRKPFRRRNRHTGQQEWFDPCQIFLSPSIRYCCLPHYAKPVLFTGPTGTGYTVRMALQVRLRPGTYSVGHQTVGATEPIDSCISNDSIEYYTKGDEHGSHILTGLLVGLEKV